MIMGLALKVADAIIRDEKGANRAVGVVGYEIVVAEVELGAATRLAFGFQDGLAGAGIAKLLGSLQILILGDTGKVLAVFGKMLFKQMLGTEAAPTRKSEERGNQETGNKGKKPIVWQ
ncbi:MAG: hypothetical protein EBY17_19560 [Acidobacteriia bacterium]|nr:hypothetical protein [Terriglobia bacterium]